MYQLVRCALICAASFEAMTWAQTTTSCQPLNETCPSNLALGAYAQWDFTTSVPNRAVWKVPTTPVDTSTNGTVYTIRQSGDSPTLRSQFYMFFGTLSVFMRASDGPGIVSSIVLLSDDLDEIDWEFLGSNRTIVQSNYFGKGDTSTYDRGVYHPLSFAPQDDFHNYTINWTKEKLEWIIDGKIIRTLEYAQAGGGKYYPQTPMKVHLGSWAAGDVANNAPGVVAWAQGKTNFANGPWTMNIKNVYIQDASSGSQYTYTDQTGNWQSIQITTYVISKLAAAFGQYFLYPSLTSPSGISPIIAEINKPFGAVAQWRALSSGTRIGIVVASLTCFGLLLAAITFCCIRSTRKGLQEHAKAEAAWAEQQREAAIWQRRYNAERASVNRSSKINRSVYG